MSLNDFELPVYSILCPLYRESNMVSHFISAIEKIDWPKDRLDVLLLLEEDDAETIQEIKQMNLPSYFRVVLIPNGQPKTKPKACNYGLSLAKGEYVVIFDAEDEPEPLQLKKAFLAFQEVEEDVKCLQAKLNYYNSQQNILTRLFTAEYSVWFDISLPGLQFFNTTIPLGGTSNHFRRQDLIELEGWDPFNVTEDADLGVRMFKKGFKTAILDATTYEEANSQIPNWVRQRSRWVKGYMQTYLVHTRDFVSFFRKNPLHAMFFHLIFGGKIASILINPLLWLVTISYFVFRPYVGDFIETLYPTSIFYFAVASLVIGNFIFLYSYMIGLAKRGQWGLIKNTLFIPFYWCLLSFAGTRAMFQLIFNPHYWEKTVHGLHLDQQKIIGKVLQSTSQVVSVEEVSPISDSSLVPGVEFTLANLKSAYNDTVTPKDTRISSTNSVPTSNFDRSMFTKGVFLSLFTLGYAGIDAVFGIGNSSDLGYISLLLLGGYLLFLPLQMVVHSQIFKKALFGTVALSSIFSVFHVFLVFTRQDTIQASYLLSVVVSSTVIFILIFFFRTRGSVLENNIGSAAGLFDKQDASNNTQKNLNILIFNWRDIKHVWSGGAEQYIHEISKRWVRQGHNVTLFCSNDTHSTSNEVIEGIRVIRRGGHYTVYILAFLYYIFKFRGNYDVVVDCENGIPFFTPLFVAKPVFLVIHHIHQEVFREHLLPPLSFIAQILESKLMPLVYHNHPIVTVSPSSKEDIKSLGFPESNISIIYNGYNKGYLKSIPKTPHPSFVYLGRLKSYKNIDQVLHVFTKIIHRYPKATLAIAGYGEKDRYLKNLAKDLGVIESVTFLGKISEKEKAQLLGKSWLSFQFSQIEGWGITVIEANACATPVIATNVKGLKDSVVHGKTGILIHPNNVEEAVLDIQKIIDDSDYRSYLAHNAVAWARQFNWDESADQFLSLIESSVIHTPALAFKVT